MHLLHFCPLSMEFNSNSVIIIAGIINKDSSPDQLDKIISIDGKFNFKNVAPGGVNVLEIAIQQKNIKLITHICKLSQGELINIVTRLSRTPLLHATLCPDLETGYLMAVELLNAGAHVNGVPDPNRRDQVIQGLGRRPTKDKKADNATPLWGILERSYNLKLFELFLKKDAVVYPSPSEEGIKFLAKYAPYPILLCAKNDDDWINSINIPRDIIKKIVGLIPSLIICDSSQPLINKSTSPESLCEVKIPEGLYHFDEKIL